MSLSLGDENRFQKAVHVAKFPLLLFLLSQRFAYKLVIALVIEDLIKDVEGVIAVRPRILMVKIEESWFVCSRWSLNENTLARFWVYFHFLYKRCVQPS